MTNSYTIIGLMSGTSCDGLDIALCTFSRKNELDWSYVLSCSKTVNYTRELELKLKQAIHCSSVELCQLDIVFAKFMAFEVNKFIAENNLKREDITAIASHGHTVFHQPEKGFTKQIGCGETMAYHTGIKVINNFRQKDIAAGGQGAPLVPIGDKLLFNRKAQAFLNIGGFCNISILNNEVIAFDVCPGNLPLNKTIERIGKQYDKNGDEARAGSINKSMLQKLNSIPYYSQNPPKSLGLEWLEEHFLSLLSIDLPTQDLLCTIIEHIAMQIARTLNEYDVNRLMISGGGTNNGFLIERIKAHFSGDVYIPDIEVIEYKEAIIFGLLGALNLAGQPNCLSSVTGASKNVIGGEIHLP